MDFSSPGWRFFRTRSSIRATTFSVSSTRVPSGPRSVMRNWLSSEAGKNSEPIRGTSVRLARKTPSTPSTTILRWPRAQWRVSWYALSSPSKNAWVQAMNRSRSPDCP